MSRISNWLKKISGPRAELLLVFVLAVGAAFVASVSGVAISFIRFMTDMAPTRGGVSVFILVFAVGILFYAVRRWRENAALEARYRALIENVPAGLFQTTLDGHFLMANQYVAELFGYPSAAELLRDTQDLAQQFYLHPAGRAALIAALERDGAATNLERQMRRRDGSLLWTLINVRAVRDARDARGAIQYLEGHIQDISARIESENLYRTLIDQSLVGVGIFQNGRYVFANPAAAELFGYTIAELLALNVEQTTELIHPNERALAAARIRDHIEGKLIPTRAILHVIRQDGAERWLEVNTNRIEYRGAPALLFLMVDATERKQAQDEMQVTLLRTAMRQDLNAIIGRAGTDLDAVLNGVARVVSSSLGDLCVVALVSEDGDWLETKAYAHSQREHEARLRKLLEHTRLSTQHPLLGQVVTNGEALLMSHLTPEMMAQAPPSPLTDYAIEFGVTSYLIAPIRHAQRVLGALGLLRERNGAAYTIQEQILLQEFADRSALAIANALLMEQLRVELDARRQVEAALRASLEQADVLQATLRDATAPDELPQLLDSICERATLLLNALSGEIYLCEPTERRLRVVSVHKTTRDFRGVTLQYGEGTAGRVALTGKPFQVLNYQTWEGRAAVYDVNDFQSVLTVPMLWQNQVIGVITVNDPNERLFTDREIKLLGLFAEQAALAVTAAHLQTRLSVRRVAQVASDTLSAASARAQWDAQAEEIFAKALRDATALLNQVADYDKVLDGILEMVARSVPYETACIYLRQADKLKVVRARGFEKYGLAEWIQNFTLPLDASNFRLLAESAKPLLIPDSDLWAGWVPVAETQWLRSHLAAPVHQGAEIVGMICLDRALVNYYHEQDGVRLAAFADLAAAALNNAELLRQAERRAQQLSLLYDAGLTLNRVLNSRIQLEFLFQIARRTLRSDQMAFYRYLPERDALCFELGIGMSDQIRAQLEAREFSVARAEGLAGWVAQQRLPALVSDVTNDARWLALQTQARAALAAPVEHENELRGVLLAMSYHTDAFTTQDERMLILLANQVAAAMELTRLFDAQARRQQELETLREANLLFAATFDRAVLIDQILAYTLRLTQGVSAHLFLYEEPRLIFGGMKWTERTPFDRPLVPRQDGLTYAVVRSGEMIVVDDVNAHPLFVERQWGGAIIGLPLRSGTQVRAVLNVIYREPHHFDTDELRVLQLLVDQAAIALENARNYAETQRQLRDAQLLHRAGRAITRTLSFTEMLERLADFFMQAVSVEACCISMLDVPRNNLIVMLDRDPIAATREAPGATYHISEIPYLQTFLKNQQTLILQRDAPELTAPIAMNMDSFFWKSVLMLPLLAGSEVIGVVELAEQRARREFSPAEIRLAESLSHQAAGALQHARLFDKVNRRVQELAALNRIAYRVSGALSLDELSAIIQEETLTLLPSEIFFFALYDAARNRVSYRRIWEGGAQLAPFEWDLQPSLTRHIIQTKRALRLDDQAVDFPPENAPQYYGGGSAHRSWLGAPIRMGERVIGVIAIENLLPRAYSQDEEQLLQTIADQIAVAVERVRETE